MINSTSALINRFAAEADVANRFVSPKLYVAF